MMVHRHCYRSSETYRMTQYKRSVSFSTHGYTEQYLVDLVSCWSWWTSCCCCCLFCCNISPIFNNESIVLSTFHPLSLKMAVMQIKRWAGKGTLINRGNPSLCRSRCHPLSYRNVSLITISSKLGNIPFNWLTLSEKRKNDRDTECDHT